MRNYHIFHIDTFTDQAFSGNPAGVVPNAEGLTSSEMQQIASEMNLSETAFLLSSTRDKSDYQIKFFTPFCEVDFCGHATLAAAWVVAQKFDLKSSSAVVTFATNVGSVPVEFKQEEDHLLMIMTQVEPKVKPVDIDYDQLASMLGVSVTDFDLQLPIKLAFTGNWHLVVPMKDQASIDQASPLFEELKWWNKDIGIVTNHLFTLNTKDPMVDIYTRDFAPAVGVNEDPVTGSANGALMSYLYMEGQLRESNQYRIIQGNSQNRPGTVLATIIKRSGHIQVKVGGSAVTTIKGMITL
ncbi:PhzF family phenazine biosynthesis protein [Halalkalibacter hemicellulosilyticus]|uniref:Phenazine biosynthesis protein PhzF like n=1 Tax=Halalkalibacter hemicellulosilyticusJCM 9152 TaxID=1236971 RepID=W4QG29_9BACI|nr:PhzF family phenazine biosynthesis protein [Halalkalibacter hemicellulosilyticus]GAE31031.1 phenazine biosynthesis protein PhzF like [Halalkalibacter hemicellulosilyticusJCM 9152]